MVTGYGASKSWIQEYEYLLDRQLKKFTIVDKKTVDNFQVCKPNCSFIPLAFCQAPSQNPPPQGQAPTQSNPVKISSKGTGADTIILSCNHVEHNQGQF